MTILVPFAVKTVGGTSSFARKFAEEAEHQGHRVVFDWQRPFDCVLVIADASLISLFIAKIRGKRIIQRLDGVYHPATPAGRWFWLYNLKMQLLHNWLADSIIYQSRFSEQSCRQFLGKTSAPTTIIYNGVDLTAYRRANPPSTPSKTLRLVTSGLFRRRDQIEPLLRSVQRLETPWELSIYGPFKQGIASLVRSTAADTRIRWVGSRTAQELAAELPLHDLYLFSDQSACPNAVLEAMAAGLPIVAFDRGSIAELVETGRNGFVVPLAHQDSFRDPYPFEEIDYQHFAESIQSADRQRVNLGTASRGIVEARFGVDTMLKQYCVALEATGL